MTRPAQISWELLTLKLRNPFRLSYGVSETRQAFWLRLADDAGWGEGTIPPYYRVDPSDMIDCWKAAAEQNKPLPDDIDAIAPWIPAGPAPARSALELAALDRIGKTRGQPLYRLLDLPAPRALTTSFTISIDAPDTMADMARQIANYPIIKIKLGSDDDAACLRAVREARPDTTLRVDANAGWTVAQAVENISWLEECRVELIEQPLPREQLRALGEVQKHTRIPIVADESVQTMQDVQTLADAGVKGINLKLMKVGGVLPALAMIRRARELGMRIMLGSMIETSLGTTAMAHLSGLADWVDLDAPLLIVNDPLEGITYTGDGRISVPNRPGIGALRKPS